MRAGSRQRFKIGGTVIPSAGVGNGSVVGRGGGDGVQERPTTPVNVASSRTIRFPDEEEVRSGS